MASKSMTLAAVAALVCGACVQAPLQGTADHTGTVVLTRPLGGGVLRVAYCNDPPQLLSETCIMGRGMEATVQAEGEVISALTISEIGPPTSIDFSRAARGELELTFYTRDPGRHHDDYVPYAKEIVRLVRGPALDFEWRFVLEKEAYDPVRAETLHGAALDAMQVPRDQESIDRLEAILCDLRNMGLDRPDPILEVFEELGRTDDCEAGEFIRDYAAEVELSMEQPRHWVSAPSTR